MIVTAYYRLRFFFLQMQAALHGMKVCRFCLRHTHEMRKCPSCGIRQCMENCYPIEVRQGEHCPACEYPD